MTSLQNIKFLKATHKLFVSPFNNPQILPWYGFNSIFQTENHIERTHTHTDLCILLTEARLKSYNRNNKMVACMCVCVHLFVEETHKRYEQHSLKKILLSFSFCALFWARIFPVFHSKKLSPKLKIQISE